MKIFQGWGEDSETRISIDGVLDAVTVGDVRRSLEAIDVDRTSRVVVDLSQLRLIDSCGVGALVALYKRARARRRGFSVVGANLQPLAILRLLNLDKLFANDTSLTASAPVAGRQEPTLGARVA
jgi:anti-sigma B factor antagonist